MAVPYRADLLHCQLYRSGQFFKFRGLVELPENRPRDTTPFRSDFTSGPTFAFIDIIQELSPFSADEKFMQDFRCSAYRFIFIVSNGKSQLVNLQYLTLIQKNAIFPEKSSIGYSYLRKDYIHHTEKFTNTFLYKNVRQESIYDGHGLPHLFSPYPASLRNQ